MLVQIDLIVDVGRQRIGGSLNRAAQGTRTLAGAVDRIAEIDFPIGDRRIPHIAVFMVLVAADFKTGRHRMQYVAGLDLGNQLGLIEQGFVIQIAIAVFTRRQQVVERIVERSRCAVSDDAPDLVAAQRRRLRFGSVMAE